MVAIAKLRQAQSIVHCEKAITRTAARQLEGVHHACVRQQHAIVSLIVSATLVNMDNENSVLIIERVGTTMNTAVGSKRDRCNENSQNQSLNHVTNSHGPFDVLIADAELKNGAVKVGP